MTSGGKPTAAGGAEAIARLVERAAGRIEILPAGGVRPGNVRELIERTGCRQVHAWLREGTGDPSVRSGVGVKLGAGEGDGEYFRVARAQVAELVAAVVGL
jgi:copper homeostasis protein